MAWASIICGEKRRDNESARRDAVLVLRHYVFHLGSYVLQPDEPDCSEVWECVNAMRESSKALCQSNDDCTSMGDEIDTIANSLSVENLIKFIEYGNELRRSQNE